ncbi:MAG: hypothetical protein GKR96_02240 [Gammaproteobacteria bacterium]|nr:hypothetical protein [Gammaproteobacteria bacterium]
MKRSILLMVLIVTLPISGCVTVIEEEKWSSRERAQAHVLLGLDYLKHDQLDIARVEFDLAFAIDGNSDTVYHGKGLLLERSGYPAQATAMFKKSIELNPRNFTAINDYAIHLCHQHSSNLFVVDGAENVSTEKRSNGTQDSTWQMNSLKGLGLLNSIENNPDNDQMLQTLLALGVCNHQLDRVDVAVEYFKVVLEKRQDLPQALLPLAEIYHQKRHYLSARGFIERYFSTGSISSRSLLLAVKVEIELDDQDSSKRYIRALTTKFPDTEEAKQLSSVLKLI